MKHLIIAIVMAVSFAANAESIKIFSTQYDSDHSFDDAAYAVNAEMGRAWVEISIADDSDWEETWYDLHRVKVAGMRFDKDINSIVFERDGRSVVCAKTSVRGRRLGRGTVMTIYPQKSCQFTSKLEWVHVDDGYYVRRRRELSVYLNIL